MTSHQPAATVPDGLIVWLRAANPLWFTQNPEECTRRLHMIADLLALPPPAPTLDLEAVARVIAQAYANFDGKPAPSLSEMWCSKAARTIIAMAEDL